MKKGIFLLLLLTIPFFSVATGQKPAKKITISGAVTDSDHKPVVGAMILIDNKKTDCITGENGTYRLKVKTDAKLITVFTMMNGMLEQPIDGKTVINFRYNTKSQTEGKVQETGQGNEAVNIGYGTMKKNDMTTTVGKIDAQNKKYASYNNIYEMIKGEVPGVQVNGTTIVIHGPSSINLSSEPLFVVNGMVVSSIADISPRQVKSIEILKGSSASIYGSRGTNGVIMITLVGTETRK
jgi:TonB-dependent SusC/RagA subfamily outer membrane receptor